MIRREPKIAKTDLFSVEEAADILQVSRQTIYNHIENGNIKYRVNRKGFYRIAGVNIIGFWNRFA